MSLICLSFLNLYFCWIRNSDKMSIPVAHSKVKPNSVLVAKWTFKDGTRVSSMPVLFTARWMFCHCKKNRSELNFYDGTYNTCFIFSLCFCSVDILLLVEHRKNTYATLHEPCLFFFFYPSRRCDYFRVYQYEIFVFNMWWRIGFTHVNHKNNILQVLTQQDIF